MNYAISFWGEESALYKINNHVLSMFFDYTINVPIVKTAFTIYCGKSYT